MGELAAMPPIQSRQLFRYIDDSLHAQTTAIDFPNSPGGLSGYLCDSCPVAWRSARRRGQRRVRKHSGGHRENSGATSFERSAPRAIHKLPLGRATGRPGQIVSGREFGTERYSGPVTQHFHTGCGWPARYHAAGHFGGCTGRAVSRRAARQTHHDLCFRRRIGPQCLCCAPD